jgi:FKBP-type peptidyl-prolyl cis-trans isomerase
MSKALANGVIVEKIVEGDGKTYPRKGNIVSVTYTGTIWATGQVFDTTSKRRNAKGEEIPFEFRVGMGEVIKGWDLGITQMSWKERSKMTIPANLAYGSTGFPCLIPPDSKIVFDVTLREVK